MFPLTPEFMLQANLPSSIQATGNDSATNADQTEGGAFTLEYRDNPFASLMRRIERLTDLDPKTAFRLAQTALADRVFETGLDERLRLKLVQLTDLVHETKEKPDLSGPFTKSALHVAPPQAFWPLPGPEPLPMPGFNR